MLHLFILEFEVIQGETKKNQECRNVKVMMNKSWGLNNDK